VGLGHASGIHLARFARAARRGLIRSHEISLVLELAGDTFASGTVIGGVDLRTAPDVSGSAVDQEAPVDQEEVAR
jgi:hypothetical protein